MPLGKIQKGKLCSHGERASMIRPLLIRTTSQPEGLGSSKLHCTSGCAGGSVLLTREHLGAVASLSGSHLLGPAQSTRLP